MNQWGTEYICPRTVWSGANQQRLWLSQSAQDATFVNYFATSLNGFPGSPAALPTAGHVLEYSVERSYRAVATKPLGILSAQDYLNTSQYHISSTAQLPSVDHLLANYVVYVPNGAWEGHLLATGQPEGAEITIDGVAVAPTEQEPIVPGWIRQVFPLAPGVHVLASSEPFVATVNGYRSFGSYMYTAGGAIE